MRLSVVSAPSAAIGYRWMLGDNAQVPLRFPSAPRVSVQFASAGIYRVTVVITGRQAAQQAALTLRVRSQLPKPAPDVNPRYQQRASAMHSRSGPLKLSALPANPTAREPVHPSVLNARHRSSQHTALSLRTRPPARKPDRHADPVHQQGDRVSGAAPRAHAATDPVVTISDFQFSSRRITVHVGNTITWTNEGPSAHTATARDGSFQTGLLYKGAAASHTFTQAGTYAYFCQMHPFMHGTVVVLVAATTPAVSHHAATGQTSSSGPSTAKPAQVVASSGGATLPVTGMSVIASALIGFLLAVLGLMLRYGERSR